MMSKMALVLLVVCVTFPACGSPLWTWSNGDTGVGEVWSPDHVMKFDKFSVSFFPKVPYADSLTLLLETTSSWRRTGNYLRFGISPDTNLANTDKSDFNTTLGFVGLTLSYFVTGPVNRFGARNFGGADLPSSAGRYAAMTMEACPDQACGTNLGILSVRTSDDYFTGPAVDRLRFIRTDRKSMGLLQHRPL